MSQNRIASFVMQNLMKNSSVVLYGGIHSKAELFEINASGFDCSTGEHSDRGDALGLKVKTLFEDGFKFGFVVQGYSSFCLFHETKYIA